MDSVCIVCNSALEWDGENGENEDNDKEGSTHDAESVHASVEMSKAPSKASSGAPPPNTRPPPSQSGKRAQHGHGHGHGHHAVHHRHGHAHVKLRKNNSSARLLTKNGAKANAAKEIQDSVNAAMDGSSEMGEDAQLDPVASSNNLNLPDWMALYCSEACRDEDELRSRLAFANLNEERRKSVEQTQRALSSSSLSPTFGPSQHHLSREMSSTRLAPSSSPRLHEAGDFAWNSDASASSSKLQQHPLHAPHDLMPKRHYAHSPAHHQVHHNNYIARQHRAASSHGSSDLLLRPMSAGSDVDRQSQHDGARRSSDASDHSSRLSAPHIAASTTASGFGTALPRNRRSSSRTRDYSTDSLASLGWSSGNEQMYLSSSSVGAPPSTSSAAMVQSHSSSSPRPEMPHRSTSALSNGLRAMTPIHGAHTVGSGYASSPGKAATKKRSTDALGQAKSASPAVIPRAAPPANVPTSAISPTSIGVSAHQPTASISIRPNSSSGGVSGIEAPQSTGLSVSSQGAATASSTFIAPSSSRTFRPASFSRSSGGVSFIKPSKSSATLAFSGTQAVHATMSDDRSPLSGGSEREHYRLSNGGHRSASPASGQRRPHNAAGSSRSTHHRAPHHTSTSSIPYLSCSPSSPGSGSINSARSNVSTDPSSSSARGEGEGCYYDDDGRADLSDDGEYVPLPRKSADEREAVPSLSSYGLFHQRTPSTPCLPSLAANAASYGRSPSTHSSFGGRSSSRLSSSYDANANGGFGGPSDTISSVFRERQNRPGMLHKSSSSLRMTPSNGLGPVPSPRRKTFDINASYAVSPTSVDGPYHPAGPARTHSTGRMHSLAAPSTVFAASAHDPRHARTTDSTPTQSGMVSRSPSYTGRPRGSSGASSNGAGRGNVTHEVVHEVAKDEHGRTRAPSITRTDLERSLSQGSDGFDGHTRTEPSSTTNSSSSTLRRLPSHLRPALAARRSFDGHQQDATSSPPPTSYHRQASHPALHSLHNQYASAEDVNNVPAGGRPLLATARSKSRSSFTWDHLPTYVPQYTALDIDRVRRNKSGTSLHSVYEDEAEVGDLAPHTDKAMPQTSSQQSTLKRSAVTSSRKRLFYFPEAEDN